MLKNNSSTWKENSLSKQQGGDGCFPDLASYKRLRDEFYSKLKAEGFKDVEDVNKPDLPLKEWHNLKFATDQMRQKMRLRAEYQRLVDAFTNSPDFDEVCHQLINHGNAKLTLENIKTIWECHTQFGMTERSIALEIRVSKTCIHGVLERLNTWMKLV